MLNLILKFQDFIWRIKNCTKQKTNIFKTSNANKYPAETYFENSTCLEICSISNFYKFQGSL